MQAAAMSPSVPPATKGGIAVSAFNNLNLTDEFHSVSSLQRGLPYQVCSLSRIDTTHGPRVKSVVSVESDQWTMLLPARFAKISDDCLATLNWMVETGMPVCLVYNGKRGTAFDVELIVKE